MDAPSHTGKTFSDVAGEAIGKYGLAGSAGLIAQVLVINEVGILAL